MEQIKIFSYEWEPFDSKETITLDSDKAKEAVSQGGIIRLKCDINDAMLALDQIKKDFPFALEEGYSFGLPTEKDGSITYTIHPRTFENEKSKQAM